MPGQRNIDHTRRGKLLTAEVVNTLIDERMRRITGGPGVQVRHMGQQAIVSATTQRGGSGGGSVRLRVKSISDDHLVCRTWDGTTEGTADILVAKPWQFRKSSWDGTTVQHLVNGNETWVAGVAGRTRYTVGNNGRADEVYPLWSKDEEIYPVTADTGVTISGVKLTLLDVSHRCWQPTGIVVGVNVQQNGGSDGNASTAATYEYGIAPISGWTVGTMTKAQTRPRAVGPVIPQTGSTGWGLAIRRTTGNGGPLLWDSGEVEEKAQCP